MVAEFISFAAFPQKPSQPSWMDEVICEEVNFSG